MPETTPTNQESELKDPRFAVTHSARSPLLLTHVSLCVCSVERLAKAVRSKSKSLNERRQRLKEKRKQLTN